MEELPIVDPMKLLDPENVIGKMFMMDIQDSPHKAEVIEKLEDNKQAVEREYRRA